MLKIILLDSIFALLYFSTCVIKTNPLPTLKLFENQQMLSLHTKFNQIIETVMVTKKVSQLDFYNIIESIPDVMVLKTEITAGQNQVTSILSTSTSFQEVNVTLCSENERQKQLLEKS